MKIFEKIFSNERWKKWINNKSVLPLCLIVVFAACLVAGGTLAYLHAQTGTVTNTFQAGNITYTLNLEANAQYVNHRNNEVTMPSAISAQTVTDLSVAFTPDKTPTLAGYTFGGWYYDEDCTEQHTAAPGTSITVQYGDSHDSNGHANKVEITLYAKWTANTNTPYRVEHYQQNVNDDNYTIADKQNLTGTTDSQVTPSVNRYTGFTSPTEQTVTIAGDGSTVVKYYYTRNSYSVSLTKGSGIASVSGAGSYRYGASVTISAETSGGYSWSNWTGTSTLSNQTSTFTMPAGNVSYTANASIVSYTISYTLNGGSVSGNPTSYTVETATFTLKNPTKTGYTFTGWTGSNGGTAQTTVSIAQGSTGNKTFTANWTPITYTIKYNNNVDPTNTSVTQPTGSTADSTHTYDVAKNLTANGFTRTGYTFTGWNTQPDGKGDSYADGESVTNLTSVQNGTVTLYAQWGVKSYVIRYHANGGTGTMADQVIEYDKLTPLRKNAFVKDGDYKFSGWATSPDGKTAEYLDSQQVVNLLESGTLDLYAVWLLNSYTVTFDYNIGYGVPPTKEVHYGEGYGVLPPYLTTETQNIFAGWYTAPEGGTRVYPETIVNRKENHTLWAHWDPSPANDVIKDLVVHSSADDNNDGVADELHLEFKCSSSFEKFNIPMKGLVPGQQYKLTYTASNNASFGDYEGGYKGSVYGSYILDKVSETGGLITNPVAEDIIARWTNRVEADGNNDGSHAATNDAWLNGPFKNRTITFTAIASTMYWTWDFGLMEDGPLYDYNIYDISLEPVVPEIEFGNKKLILYDTSTAKVLNDTSSAYNSNFVFYGASYAETMYYPITGLTAGTTYTITFDHKYSGSLIDSNSYDYGCGIMASAPTVYGSKMSSLGSYLSNTFVMPSATGNTESVTLTFKATGNTAYWVWNMANCGDYKESTIDIKVTKFSATHAGGGSITYYTAPSQAMLSFMMPKRVQEISMVWDGIDDTNMEIWYPVDEQSPVAGDSYELAFEPMEGYTMAEVITVAIDDVTYEVYTDGRTTDGDVAPTYDSETNTLTIPGELLTAETTTVAVTASAVLEEADTGDDTAETDEEVTGA